MKPGKVWLVGAGPGDPELLTLKAARVIGAGDVLLVDALVNRAVLEHARHGARVIDTGKRGGCASTPQDFIERLMVREALAGRTVVRLKGGDPFLFGRGGEEWRAAVAAGLEVEAVPGVTSALAATAALGIPATDRAAGPGVAFITGHRREGAPEPDWAALAKSGLTLMIYMGIANVEHIGARLIEGGLSSDTPAAAISAATLPRQASVTATLGTLACAVREGRIASPAVLVIGEVARGTMDAALRHIGSFTGAARASA